MAITQNITITVGTGGAGGITGTCVDTADTQTLVDHTYAAETVDADLAVAFTTAALRSLAIFIAAGDCTIVTNPGGTGQTIVLTPGVPYI